MLLHRPTSSKRQTAESPTSGWFRRIRARSAGALDTRCLACGARGGRALCAACFHDLPWNDHACRYCALPLPDSPATLCGTCARRPPHFDVAHAAFGYGWPVDRLIRRFKFKADLAMGRILALALADYLDLHQLPRPDLLIPVPLHRRRLAERGFNQSAEIARVLGPRLETKTSFNGLIRLRDTPAQSGLDRAARLRNLRGAFACGAPVAGLRVAVVDDVITTGSTVETLADVLKRAGAAEVAIYAIARA
ncbi:MAG: double zinc ribbon domain-containing protein [Gammaproteobacteria bacterium]